MKKPILILVSLCVLMLSVNAQERKLNAYVVGFYNLENLFDTIDSPNTNDSEYTPVNGWGTLKYTNKLQKMAHAISKFPQGLAILGVAEIENVDVLEDLIKEPAIQNRNLQAICIEGPDKRGVDVGLLYNPSLFQVTSITSTRVKSDIEEFYTRDQLCVTGLLAGEEVSVIVLHWPSRGGGIKRSYPRRRDAALTTKSIVDSLNAINPNAKIIVMGDLNDDPTDDSVIKYLGAKGKVEQLSLGDMFNPFYALYKKGIGSIGYQDQWSLFDQIMLSYPFIGKDYNQLQFYKAKVFNEDFLKQQEGKYKGYPLRTHSGGVWTNGYSDHFPSLVWLVKYAQ